MYKCPLCDRKFVTREWGLDIVNLSCLDMHLLDDHDVQTTPVMNDPPDNCDSDRLARLVAEQSSAFFAQTDWPERVLELHALNLLAGEK
jgi:hypothetical protein